jgi:RHS repeat-associated protein
VVYSLEVDEFGNVLSESGDATLLPHGFAGGLWDRDTGLVRYGARDYDAYSGRWTARDPILFGGGQSNLYAYVDNDPVNRVDPRGLGYYDFNVSAGFGLGITFGAFYDPDSGEVHPYLGGGLMTPGASVCISASQEDISPDQWSGQLQVEVGPAFGAVGYGGGSWFGEVGAGWGFPVPGGASLTGYYTW